MTITEHIRKFERHYAQSPKTSWLGDNPDYYAAKSYNDRNQAIVEIAKWHCPGIILDVGCGTGDLMVLLRPYCHYIIGVEPTHINREIVLSKELTVRYGVAEALPKADQSVDMVVMADVIEHLYNPSLALVEAWRVLIPGGILIITTPNKWAEWFWYLSSSRLFKKDKVPDNLYTPKHLATLVNTCHMKVVSHKLQECYPRSTVGKWLLHQNLPWSAFILKLMSKIKLLNYRQVVVLKK